MNSEGEQCGRYYNLPIYPDQCVIELINILETQSYPFCGKKHFSTFIFGGNP